MKDIYSTSQGFIARVVEQRTGIAEVIGSNPVVAFIFLCVLTGVLEAK